MNLEDIERLRIVKFIQYVLMVCLLGTIGFADKVSPYLMYLEVGVTWLVTATAIAMLIIYKHGWRDWLYALMPSAVTIPMTVVLLISASYR